jgi:hypothetical protein
MDVDAPVHVADSRRKHRTISTATLLSSKSSSSVLPPEVTLLPPSLIAHLTRVLRAAAAHHFDQHGAEPAHTHTGDAANADDEDDDESRLLATSASLCCPGSDTAVTQMYLEAQQLSAHSPSTSTQEQEHVPDSVSAASQHEQVLLLRWAAESMRWQPCVTQMAQIYRQSHLRAMTELRGERDNGVSKDSIECAVKYHDAMSKRWT